MKLKKATMLAIIGTSIIVCYKIFEVVTTIRILMIGNDYDWIVSNIITGSISVIAYSMLLSFFIVLYKNQKK